MSANPEWKERLDNIARTIHLSKLQGNVQCVTGTDPVQEIKEILYWQSKNSGRSMASLLAEVAAECMKSGSDDDFHINGIEYATRFNEVMAADEENS